MNIESLNPKVTNIKNSSSHSDNSWTTIESSDSSYRFRPGSSLTSNSVSKYQEKGLIFVWPQRRKFYNTKELVSCMWFVSQVLYFLNSFNLFPGESDALWIKQPPWNYKPKVRKPENRDYIIEPDWDSASST